MSVLSITIVKHLFHNAILTGCNARTELYGQQSDIGGVMNSAKTKNLQVRGVKEVVTSSCLCILFKKVNIKKTRLIKFKCFNAFNYFYLDNQDLKLKKNTFKMI